MIQKQPEETQGHSLIMKHLIFTDHLGNVGVDGRIILKWIWIGFIWLKAWSVVVSYEHGNESSVTTNDGEFTS
jgi:hypothetical protein